MAVTGKVAKYIYNLGKSVVYSTVDQVKEIAPETIDFVETNSDLARDVYSSIKDYRNTFKRANAGIKKSKIYEAANIGIKAFKEDIFTGNFYNKERSSSAGFAGFDDDFGDDFDFNKSDFDNASPDATFGLKGDIMVAKSIAKSSKRMSTAVGKSIAASTEILVESDRAGQKMAYVQNQKHFNMVSNGLETINTNVGNMLKFANDVIKTHVDNSTKFYTQMTDLTTKQLNILQIIQNEVAPQTTTKDKNSNKVDLSDVLSGGLNIKSYFKAVKQNFMNSQAGQLMGLGNMFGDDSNMFAQLTASPLQFIPNFIARSMIGQIKNPLKTFNNTLNGFIGSMLAKVTSYGENEEGGFLSRTLGKLFGVKPKRKNSINTGEYEKGKMSWNGIANKALTEVIPSQLSKIISLLSGQSEKVFDYNKGQWVNALDTLKDYARHRDSYSQRTDLQAEMNQQASAFQFNNDKDRETFFKDMENFFKDAFTRGGRFSDIYDNKEHENYLDHGISSDRNYRVILELFKHSSEENQVKFNRQMMELINDQKRYFENEEKNTASVIRTVMGNFHPDEYITREQDGPNKGKIKEVKSGLASLDISKIKDDLGNNIFYYLQEITKNSSYIREYGLPSRGGSNNVGRRLSTHNDSRPRFEDVASSYLNDSESENRLRRMENEQRRLENINERNRQEQERADNRGLSTVNISDMDVEHPGELISTLEANRITRDIRNNEEEIRRREREQQSLSNQLGKANGFMEKARVFKNKIQDLTRKPFEFIGSVLKKADKHMFNLLFGQTKYKGQDVKGIMGMIKLELHNTFQKTNDWLDDHLFKPIKEKLGIEKFSDLGKKVMGIFGLDELYKSAKQALFGDPNNDEDHGIMGNIKDGIKEAFKSTGSWIKEGFINIKDAVWNTPLIQSLFNSPKQQQRRADREIERARRQREREDAEREAELQRNIEEEVVPNLKGGKITSRSKKGIPSSSEYDNEREAARSFGSRLFHKFRETHRQNYINKREKLKEKEEKFINPYIDDEFEDEVWNEMGHFYSGRQQKIHNKMKDKDNKPKQTTRQIINTINTDYNNRKQTGQFDGYKIEANEDGALIATLSTGEIVIPNDPKNMDPASFKEALERLIKADTTDYAKHKILKAGNLTMVGINGKAFENKIFDQIDILGASFKSFAEKFLGKLDDREEGKIVSNKIKEIMSETQKKYPAAIGGAAVGMVGSTLIGGMGIPILSSIIGSPLLGAAIGGAIAMSKKSERFNRILFGDDNEKGLVPKGAQKFLKEKLPKYSRNAVLGAIASPLLLGTGPLMSIMLGLGVGHALESEKLKERLFGNEAKTSAKKKIQYLKEHLPAGAIGAMGGMKFIAPLLSGFGPFGLIGGMALGAGAGLFTTTDEFKHFLFGRKDPRTGKNFGGVLPTMRDKIFNPMTSWMKQLGKDISGWFHESIANNMKRAFKPLMHSFKNGITGIGKALAFPFKKAADVFFPNLSSSVSRKIGDAIDFIKHPVRYSVESLGKVAGKFFEKPFQALGALGDRKRQTHIANDDAAYMTASERLEFVTKNGLRGKEYTTAARDKILKSISESADNKATYKTINEMIDSVMVSDKKMDQSRASMVEAIRANVSRGSEKDYISRKHANSITALVNRGDYKSALNIINEQLQLAKNSGDTKKIKNIQYMKSYVESQITELKKLDKNKSNTKAYFDSELSNMKKNDKFGDLFLGVNSMEDLKNLKKYINKEQDTMQIIEKDPMKEAANKAMEQSENQHKELIEFMRVITTAVKSIAGMPLSNDEEKIVETNKNNSAEAKAREILEQKKKDEEELNAAISKINSEAGNTYTEQFDYVNSRYGILSAQLDSAKIYGDKDTIKQAEKNIKHLDEYNTRLKRGWVNDNIKNNKLSGLDKDLLSKYSIDDQYNMITEAMKRSNEDDEKFKNWAAAVGVDFSDKSRQLYNVYNKRINDRNNLRESISTMDNISLINKSDPDKINIGVSGKLEQFFRNVDVAFKGAASVYTEISPDGTMRILRTDSKSDNAIVNSHIEEIGKDKNQKRIEKLRKKSEKQILDSKEDAAKADYDRYLEEYSSILKEVKGLEDEGVNANSYTPKPRDFKSWLIVNGYDKDFNKDESVHFNTRNDFSMLRNRKKNLIINRQKMNGKESPIDQENNLVTRLSEDIKSNIDNTLEENINHFAEGTAGILERPVIATLSQGESVIPKDTNIELYTTLKQFREEVMPRILQMSDSIRNIDDNTETTASIAVNDSENLTRSMRTDILNTFNNKSNPNEKIINSITQQDHYKTVIDATNGNRRQFKEMQNGDYELNMSDANTREAEEEEKESKKFSLKDKLIGAMNWTKDKASTVKEESSGLLGSLFGLGKGLLGGLGGLLSGGPLGLLKLGGLAYLINAITNGEGGEILKGIIGGTVDLAKDAIPFLTKNAGKIISSTSGNIVYDVVTGNSDGNNLLDQGLGSIIGKGGAANGDKESLTNRISTQMIRDIAKGTNASGKFLSKSILGKIPVVNLPIKAYDKSIDLANKGVSKFAAKFNPKVAGDLAGDVTEKVVKTSSTKAAIKAAEETADAVTNQGFFKTLINGVKKVFNYIFDSSIVKGLIGSKICTKAKGFVKNFFEKKIGNAIKKAGTSIAQKLAWAVTKTGCGLSPLAIAMLIGDFGYGFANAKDILGILDDPTIGQRFVGGLASAVLGTAPFAMISILFTRAELVSIFIEFASAIGFDMRSIQTQRAKADNIIAAYNAKHGTDYKNVDELYDGEDNDDVDDFVDSYNKNNVVTGSNSTGIGGDGVSVDGSSSYQNDDNYIDTNTGSNSSSFVKTASNAALVTGRQMAKGAGTLSKVGTKVINGTKSVAKKTKEIAGTVAKKAKDSLNSGILGKILNGVKSVFEGIFKNSTVKSLVGESVCAKAVKSVGNVIKNLGERLLKKGSEKIAMLTAKATAKGALGVTPIGWVLLATDFVWGFANARSILGILDDPTFCQRLISGLFSAITGTTPFALISIIFSDAELMAFLIDVLLPTLGFNMSDIQNQRSKADNIIAAYNDKYGTDFSNVDEFTDDLSDDEIDEFTKEYNSNKGVATDPNKFSDNTGYGGDGIKLNNSSVKNHISSQIGGIGGDGIKLRNKRSIPFGIGDDEDINEESQDSSSNNDNYNIVKSLLQYGKINSDENIGIGGDSDKKEEPVDDSADNLGISGLMTDIKSLVDTILTGDKKSYSKYVLSDTIKSAIEEMIKTIFTSTKEELKVSDSYFGNTGNNAPVNSGYGIRTINGQSEFHDGIDYGYKENTPVFSPISGEVTDNKYDKDGFGYHLAIKDDNDNNHIFAHLKEKPPFARKDKVVANQCVGISGNTGNSSGPHLHYGIRKNIKDKGSGLDPNKYLYNYYKDHEDKLSEFSIKNGKGGDGIKLRNKKSIPFGIGDDVSKTDSNAVGRIQGSEKLKDDDDIQMAYQPREIRDAKEVALKENPNANIIDLAKVTNSTNKELNSLQGSANSGILGNKRNYGLFEDTELTFNNLVEDIKKLFSFDGSGMNKLNPSKDNSTPFNAWYNIVSNPDEESSVKFPIKAFYATANPYIKSSKDMIDVTTFGVKASKPYMTISNSGMPVYTPVGGKVTDVIKGKDEDGKNIVSIGILDKYGLTHLFDGLKDTNIKENSELDDFSYIGNSLKTKSFTYALGNNHDDHYEYFNPDGYIRVYHNGVINKNKNIKKLNKGIKSSISPIDVVKNTKMPFNNGNVIEYGKGGDNDIEEETGIRKVATLINQAETGNRFDMVTPLDVNAMAIGAGQMNGNAARDLIKQMINKNPEKVKLLLSGTSLYNEVMQNKDWSSRAASNVEVQKLKQLLSSEVGTEVQISNLLSRVKSHFNYGKNVYGLKDLKAALYYTDLGNNSSDTSPNMKDFMKETSSAAGGADKITLDFLHKSAMKSYLGNKQSRASWLSAHGRSGASVDYTNHRNIIYNGLKNINSVSEFGPGVAINNESSSNTGSGDISSNSGSIKSGQSWSESLFNMANDITGGHFNNVNKADGIKSSSLKTKAALESSINAVNSVVSSLPSSLSSSLSTALSALNLVSGIGDDRKKPYSANSWFTKTDNAIISSGYGNRNINGRQEKHDGIDYAMKEGSSVRSPISGTITYSGQYDKKDISKGFGNFVSVKDSNGYNHIFGHLKKPLGKVGDRVSAGDMVGLSGNTGNSTGPHLHYGIRKNIFDRGTGIDPNKYLGRGTDSDYTVGDNKVKESKVDNKLKYNKRCIGDDSDKKLSTSDIENQDLKKYGADSLTAEEINAWINSKTNSKSHMYNKGEAFIRASKLTGLDPRYIVSHAAIESAWGTSNICDKKANFFGIGAFDNSPYASAHTFGGESGDKYTAGIIGGAKWINDHYYESKYGQKTLRSMRFNNGVHQYATDPKWASNIASTWAKGPLYDGKSRQNYQGYSSNDDSNEENNNSYSNNNDINKNTGMVEDGYKGLLDDLTNMKLFDVDSNLDINSSKSNNNKVTGNPVDGNNAVDYMKSVEGKLRYSQSNRNPDKGSADCSSTVAWALNKAAGYNVVNPYSNTETYVNLSNEKAPWVDRSTFKEDGSGKGKVPDESKLIPGDMLLYTNYNGPNGRPYNVGHVEMYAGDGQRIGHGGPGKGPVTSSLSASSHRYIGARRVMADDIAKGGDGLDVNEEYYDYNNDSSIDKPNKVINPSVQDINKSLKNTNRDISTVGDNNVNTFTIGNNKNTNSTLISLISSIIVLLKQVSSNTSDISKIVELLKTIVNKEVNTSNSKNNNTDNLAVANAARINTLSKSLASNVRDKDSENTINNLVSILTQLASE